MINIQEMCTLPFKVFNLMPYFEKTVRCNIISASATKVLFSGVIANEKKTNEQFLVNNTFTEQTDMGTFISENSMTYQYYSVNFQQSSFSKQNRYLLQRINNLNLAKIAIKSNLVLYVVIKDNIQISNMLHSLLLYDNKQCQQFYSSHNQTFPCPTGRLLRNSRYSLA